MEVSRSEIIKRLGDLTREQGIAFLSEKEAIDYYRALVDLILDLAQPKP